MDPPVLDRKDDAGDSWCLRCWSFPLPLLFLSEAAARPEPDSITQANHSRGHRIITVLLDAGRSRHGVQDESRHQSESTSAGMTDPESERACTQNRMTLQIHARRDPPPEFSGTQQGLFP